MARSPGNTSQGHESHGERPSMIMRGCWGQTGPSSKTSIPRAHQYRHSRQVFRCWCLEQLSVEEFIFKLKRNVSLWRQIKKNCFLMETLVTVKFCPAPYALPCYLAKLGNLVGRSTIRSVKQTKKLVFFCCCYYSFICFVFISIVKYVVSCNPVL